MLLQVVLAGVETADVPGKPDAADVEGRKPGGEHVQARTTVTALQEEAELGHDGRLFELGLIVQQLQLCVE